MPRPTVHRAPFGPAHGTETHRWTLDSGTGVRAEVLTYGATLHRLTVPDASGAAVPVVRSLAGIDDYTAEHPYFGAVVGRYANRIAHGRFTLDGTDHHVPANDRGHALHGGPGGFHTKVWEAAGDRTGDTASVRLTLHSPDGDMGFPGALDTTVTYTLDTAGTLAIDYASVTDRPTVLNLTNHAYFDLAGQGDVLGHRLEVDADAYLPVDGGGIPLGPAADVKGTPFDLTQPRVLGERLGLDDAQLRAAGGFDHCWVLREAPDGSRGAPPGSPRRTGAASWRCGRPGRASRCTRPTSWTAGSPTPPADVTNATVRCAWRHSTCPTPPTVPTSPAPCCAPANRPPAGPSCASHR